MIALPTLVIYVVVLGLLVARLHAVNRVQVQAEMTALAVNYAGRFDGAFREAAAIARTTAAFMDSAPEVSEEAIYTQLRANTLQNPIVFGAAMAFEPGAYYQDDRRFCPYVYRGPEGTRQMNINRDIFDWYIQEKWQWWHLPKQTGRSVWTDPYFDEGAGNVLMVTYSVPFERNGTFRGVTTVDILLPALQESVGREIVSDLRFLVLSPDGRFVYSPIEGDIMSRTAIELARELQREDVASAFEHILTHSEGVVTLPAWERDEGGHGTFMAQTQWAFFAPIESTGWTFVAMLPEHEALAGVQRRTMMAGIGLAFTLALIIGCIVLMSARLTDPIASLRSKVLAIADGDFDASVGHVGGGAELDQLGQCVDRMTANLRSHIDRLAHERAGREKIERDLDLAREIQRGLLPREVPITPGFEVAGWNLPADKTGGDYYDWLTLSGDRTIFTLADVTGHGIGPALIVAVCRAYMRAAASTGHASLSEAVARANELLTVDIPAGRFITAAIGVLSCKTATLEMISAGQAPILFYEAATGTVHNWDADEIPLGVAHGLAFDISRHITFSAGDVLLLTTDGFMEWPNAQGQQFGSTKLEAFLAEHHALTATQLIECLHQTVLAYANGVQQRDDLTALVIRKL